MRSTQPELSVSEYDVRISQASVSRSLATALTKTSITPKDKLAEHWLTDVRSNSDLIVVLSIHQLWLDINFIITIFSFSFIFWSCLQSFFMPLQCQHLILLHQIPFTSFLWCFVCSDSRLSFTSLSAPHAESCDVFGPLLIRISFKLCPTQCVFNVCRWMIYSYFKNIKMLFLHSFSWAPVQTTQWPHYITGCCRLHTNQTQLDHLCGFTSVWCVWPHNRILLSIWVSSKFWEATKYQRI